jgi:hypothetical protein
MAQLKVTYTLNGDKSELESALGAIEEGELSVADVFNPETDSVDYDWDYSEAA